MKKGFTLIELMMVVIIVGILAAVAVPNYLNQQWKAKKGACKQNLKQIYDAVSLSIHENSGSYSEDDIKTYFPQNTMPKCPAAGSYSYNVVKAADINVEISCTGNKGPIVHGKFDGGKYYE